MGSYNTTINHGTKGKTSYIRFVISTTFQFRHYHYSTTGGMLKVDARRRRRRRRTKRTKRTRARRAITLTLTLPGLVDPPSALFCSGISHTYLVCTPCTRRAPRLRRGIIIDGRRREIISCHADPPICEFAGTRSCTHHVDVG